MRIRIETSFDEVTYRKVCTNYLDEDYKALESRAKQLLILSSLGLLVGLFIIFSGTPSGKYSGFVIAAIAFHFLLLGIRAYQSLGEARKVARQAIDRTVERLSERQQPVIFEFDEEYFYYEDADVKSEVKWKLITGYRILRDGIILNSKYELGINYLVCREFVTDEQYDELLKLVSRKIPTDEKTLDSMHTRQKSSHLLDDEL